MNRLKAWFISSFVTINSLLSLYSIWQISQTGFDWFWIGLLLLVFPGVGFLAYLYLVGMARTSENLGGILIAHSFGLGFLLFAIFDRLSTGPITGLEITLAAVGAVSAFGGGFLYVFWYSRLGRQESDLLKPGVQLPELEFENPAGETVKLSSIEGRYKLLMFYRGNWCPLCMTQIKEVAELYRELKAAGVEVVLVSPQPHSNTESLAKKFDVDFHFMVDKDRKTAKLLRIEHEGGLPATLEVLGYDEDTVFPTVVMVNADHEVVLADQTDNYRMRPHPQTFLDAIA